MKYILQEYTGVVIDKALTNVKSCDKISREDRPEVGNCPACSGSGQVLVKDGDKSVSENCIMCWNDEENTSEPNRRD